MAATSLAKGQSPQCFACFKPKLWRTYDVNGKKWKKEKVKDKLTGIFGEEVYGAIEKENIGLCHSCLCRLQSSYAFAQQIRRNLCKLGRCDSPKADSASASSDSESSPAHPGTHLLLDKQVISHWRRFANKHNLKTDSDVATALLKRCESAKSMPASWCDKCGSPLVLCCTSCERKTWDRDCLTSQRTKTSTMDFGCMFPETPGETSLPGKTTSLPGEATSSPVLASKRPSDTHTDTSILKSHAIKDTHMPFSHSLTDGCAPSHQNVHTFVTEKTVPFSQTSGDSHSAVQQTFTSAALPYSQSFTASDVQTSQTQNYADSNIAGAQNLSDACDSQNSAESALCERLRTEERLHERIPVSETPYVSSAMRSQQQSPSVTTPRSDRVCFNATERDCPAASETDVTVQSHSVTNFSTAFPFMREQQTVPLQQGSAGQGHSVPQGSAGQGHTVLQGSTGQGHTIPQASAGQGHIIQHGSADHGHTAQQGSAGQGHTAQQGSVGQGLLLNSQAPEQSSSMLGNPQYTLLLNTTDVSQHRHWSQTINTIGSQPSQEGISHTLASDYKADRSSLQPQTVSQEDVAAGNTLLELFESNPPAGQSGFLKKKQHRIPLQQGYLSEQERHDNQGYLPEQPREENQSYLPEQPRGDNLPSVVQGGNLVGEEAYCGVRRKNSTQRTSKDNKPRPFVCRECGMAFFTSTILRRHMRTHTGEKPFRCPHCGDAFRQSNGLKRHVLAVHASNKKYHCRRCGATFPSHRLLLEHRSSHEELRRFTCDVCGTGFRRPYDLKIHREMHTGSKVQIQCRVCDTTVSTVVQLRRHERSKHSDIADAKYKCTECSRAFRSPHSLKEHLKAHVPGGPYLCHICSEPSSTLFEARKHVYSMHPGEKVKLFSCAECGKSFTSEAYARFHQAAHSGEKPYVCGQCGASFHYPANLHAHEKIHTGIRNYVCKLCGDKFLRPPHLKKHMKLHEGDALLPCAVCGVSFNSKRSLSNHMHSHEKKDRRRFVCEVCGMKQWTASGLRQHMRTHTGEKPHICAVCGAAFTWSSGLQYHMRYHDNKNCVCEICGVGFIWKSELKHHMDSHQGTKS